MRHRLSVAKEADDVLWFALSLLCDDALGDPNIPVQRIQAEEAVQISGQKQHDNTHGFEAALPWPDKIDRKSHQRVCHPNPRYRCAFTHSAPCRLTKKAEPPPTRDVNRDSGTASANGGWLRRLVGRVLSSSITRVTDNVWVPRNLTIGTVVISLQSSNPPLQEHTTRAKSAAATRTTNPCVMMPCHKEGDDERNYHEPFAQQRERQRGEPSTNEEGCAPAWEPAHSLFGKLGGHGRAA